MIAQFPTRTFVSVQLVVLLVSLLLVGYIWAKIPSMLEKQAEVQEKYDALKVQLDQLAKAVALIQQGQSLIAYDRARAFQRFAQARQLVPDNPAVIDLIAGVHLAAGHYADAVNVLQDQMQTSLKSFTPAYLTLAKAKCGLNDRQGALMVISEAEHNGIKVRDLASEDIAFRSICRGLLT